jgi:hypothetical protein
MKQLIIAVIAALSFVSFNASADYVAPSAGPFTHTGTAGDSEL